MLDASFRRVLRPEAIRETGEIGTPLLHRLADGRLVMLWYADKRLCRAVSADDGRTWTGGRRMTDDAGAWTTLNDRAMITTSGRIVVPIDHLLGREGPDPDVIGTVVSDDGGRTWYKGDVFGPPEALPMDRSGVREPVRFRNGRRLAELRGRRATLRFLFGNGTLYSYRFANT